MRKVLHAFVALFTLSVCAHADTIFDYTLTGTNNSLLWTWQMDSNPIPTLSFADDYFIVFPIQGTFDGDFSYYRLIQFIANPNGYPGNVSGADIGGGFNGPQLFSGPTSAPQMSAGTFLLSDNSGEMFKLVAVDTGIAPTPEPSTIGLLGTGLLSLFGVMRRRTKKNEAQRGC